MRVKASLTFTTICWAFMTTMPSSVSNAAAAMREASSVLRRSDMSRKMAMNSMLCGDCTRVTAISTGNRLPVRCRPIVSTRAWGLCPGGEAMNNSNHCRYTWCRLGGSTSSCRSMPSTSWRNQPKQRSACGFHSTMVPVASICTMASKACSSVACQSEVLRDSIGTVCADMAVCSVNAQQRRCAGPVIFGLNHGRWWRCVLATSS